MPLKAVLAIANLLLTISAADARPRDFLKQTDAWYAGDEARRIAARVMSFQSELGGWPKNVDTTAGPFTGDRSKLKPTYDNGATTDELRLLARIYAATDDEIYRDALQRGLDYVLQGQYPNGGWPQSFPPGNGYHRHITFNDNVMVRLLEFVREVASQPLYDFLDDAEHRAAGQAFDRGIECIIKCQIPVNETLTGWCAQHDEIDFRPQPARAYELATLSGAESVGVVRLLISIDDPPPEIVDSIESAVAWLQSAKLTGVRLAKQNDERAPNGGDIVLVNDPAAPPLWARFYDIETNAPVFVDRDGIPKPALADIGYERRNGYDWYGDWPRKLLDREYPRWRERIAGKR